MTTDDCSPSTTTTTATTTANNLKTWSPNGISFAQLVKSNIVSPPANTNRGTPILSLPPPPLSQPQSPASPKVESLNYQQQNKKRVKPSRKKNHSPQYSSTSDHGDDVSVFSMEKVQISLPSPPMSGAPSPPPLNHRRLSDDQQHPNTAWTDDTTTNTPNTSNTDNDDETAIDSSSPHLSIHTTARSPVKNARGRGYRFSPSTHHKYSYQQHHVSAPPVTDYLFYVKSQVEYYFSVENLCKDIYLRKHMDDQGFLSVEFLAGFNRLKAMGCTVEHIVDALQDSTVVEVVDQALRKKDDWNLWVLPRPM